MKFRIYILLFILLNTFQKNINAQDPVIDSLNLVLKSTKNDTTRLKLLSELSELCEIEDILKYAEPMVKLAEANIIKDKTHKLFYLKHLATAFNNIGFYYDQQDDITNGLKYYHKALNIQESIHENQEIASTLNNIGFVYKRLGDISKALDYYHKSLKVEELSKNEEGIASSLINIGSLIADQGDYQNALEYFFKALKFYQKNNDKQHLAILYNNIGGIYVDMKNSSKASDYFKNALSISEEIKDKVGIARALNNIACNEKDNQLALNYFDRSMIILYEINDKKTITGSLNNISRTLLNQGKDKLALEYALKSLKMANELGYPEHICNTALNLKNIYLKQHHHKEALQMYELYIQMRDSTNNQNTRKASIKKQFQYEYEKQAAADSVKHAEEQKVKNAQLAAQSASLKQEQTQRYALYGGLILVIAFSGFVFNRFKVTQKQKKIIEDQKVLVDKAYESLHEKNKEVIDSITYARRIQRALLTSEKYIERNLNKLNKNN